MNFRDQKSIDKFVEESEGIKVYEGNIRIGLSNSNITNLDGLINLERINGSLTIENNSSLDSIKGLRNLTRVDGELRIANNESLLSLDGLDELKEINGALILLNNKNLNEITALNKLKEINGALFISQNSSLMNLIGLDNLELINGRLQVTNNEELTSLEGLNVRINGLKNDEQYFIQGLIIRNNPKLSNCSIKAICTLLEAEGLRYDISENAEGCNSKSEIINRI